MFSSNHDEVRIAKYAASKGAVAAAKPTDNVERAAPPFDPAA